MTIFQPKPHLLIISSVLPFPRNAGQQQRVYYKLKALRDKFRITFLTVADQADLTKTRSKLLEFCDEALVLPSCYTKHWTSRIFHKVVGTLFELVTGLRFSNYLTGNVEFTPSRLQMAMDGQDFDGVLFEYWHAYKVTRVFRAANTYTILDMHDILWRSYARQLDASTRMPRWLKEWRIRQYQQKEEASWNDFDALIAINQDELEYARQRVSEEIQIFFAPMGTDISAWPYSWQPVDEPRRVSYYGGLANPQNQRDALLCYQEIMPIIWRQLPEVEFWIVGSNPPDFIKDLEQDPRVHVTGFLENPQDVLKTASFVLCPWSGTFGFRSRVVEVMSLGIPVVASRDAVYGMGLEIGHGIFVNDTSNEMAMMGLRLLNDMNELDHQSMLARRQIEEKFSYEATYVKLADELSTMLAHSQVL